MAHEGCIDAVKAAAEARKKKMSQNESREPVGVMTRSQSCEIVTVGQQRALRQSFGSLQHPAYPVLIGAVQELLAKSFQRCDLRGLAPHYAPNSIGQIYFGLGPISIRHFCFVDSEGFVPMGRP